MKTLATLTLTALLGLGATAALAQPVPGQNFIENFDDNGDGQVTLEEIILKRGEILYMFDQNEDGILDSAEYDLFDETRAADQAANHAPGYGQTAGAKAMSREVTDVNGDGVVTREEFIQTSTAWFEMKDRNGDGVITLADFGPISN